MVNVIGHKLTKKYKHMRTYTSKKWKQKLDNIDNVYLKRKLACLIFWDFSDYFSEECLYIKRLMYEYKYSESELVSEDEVKDGLHQLGYPLWLAQIRCKKPKKHKNIRR